MVDSEKSLDERLLTVTRALERLGDEASPAALAVATDLSPTTLRRRLAELRAAGLVTGGQRSLRLTEAGRCLLDEAPDTTPGDASVVEGDVGHEPPAEWPAVWDPAPAPDPEPVRVPGKTCSGCGQDIVWSPGGSMWLCPQGCDRPAFPPMLVPEERPRDPRRVPDRDEALDARLALAARRDQLLAAVEERRGDDELDAPSRGMLRQFATEVREAPSVEALAWIAGRLWSLPLQRAEPEPSRSLSGPVIDVEGWEDDEDRRPGAARVARGELLRAGEEPRAEIERLAGRHLPTRKPRPALPPGSPHGGDGHHAPVGGYRPCAAPGCRVEAVWEADMVSAPAPLVAATGGLPVRICSLHRGDLEAIEGDWFFRRAA